jgi:hypothetical protein
MMQARLLFLQDLSFDSLKKDGSVFTVKKPRISAAAFTAFLSQRTFFFMAGELYEIKRRYL